MSTTGIILISISKSFPKRNSLSRQPIHSETTASTIGHIRQSSDLLTTSGNKSQNSRPFAQILCYYNQYFINTANLWTCLMLLKSLHHYTIQTIAFMLLDLHTIPKWQKLTHFIVFISPTKLGRVLNRHAYVFQ